MSTLHRRTLFGIFAVAAAGTLAGCAQSQRTPDSASTSAGQPGSTGTTAETFIFAGSSDPVMLDPAMASDGETFRIARQIFEGLVTVEPGSTELAPLLATEWTSSDDGLAHTFTLKEGVTFHDGTPFNADAVVANFERWANWSGINQNENITYYYGKLFRGYRNPEDGAEPGIYDRCETNGDNEVTVHLTAPFASFVDAMTLPAFSMQSPSAMEQYNADNTQGTVDDPRFSEYATAHPTGTGPFTFESWDRGQQVTLVRNDDYHGEAAQVSRVVVRIISDARARTQELQAGNIDGYDLVAPADIQVLKDAGFQVLNRPAFNILYLGINQNVNPAMQDIRVRQAINHAIDKDAVISQSLPEGSIAAIEYMPDSVNGYNPDVTQYAYDPDRARELLAEAGQADLTLRFAYPTGVSRPYMPTPEDTFVAIRAQLEAVGITVEPVTARWSPDYLDMVQSDAGIDQRDVHFLGWTGDYNDPDNFIGVFFGQHSNEWGFDNTELFTALAEARQLATADEQEARYAEINQMIADFVPGVPIAHPAPSLALGPGVEGYEPSPVQDEVWNTITITR
ncbi:ABC transporter substrate-binding protein [Propioniciclava soli]|uniref:ABC transporter substrate-binding protein n=1 Tax=Propioniciclava soli TaxID=2775081 RepID=A0ABZ3C9B9_9ACTN